MTRNELREVIDSQYSELGSLSGATGLFDFPEYTLNMVLDYYYDHDNQHQVYNTIQCLDNLLSKYKDDTDTLSQICDDLFFYNYLYEFESAVALLLYMKKYLLEKLSS